MSSDNTVVVQRHGKSWHVWMALGDEEEAWRPSGPWHKSFMDELDAIHYAQEVCDKEVVEYGIVVLPPQ